MFRFHKISIKKKLSFIIVTTSMIVVLLATGAFVANDLISFKKNMVADLKTLADIIGKNATAALMFDDADTAGENITSLKADQTIVMGAILSKEEIFANYIREGEHSSNILSDTNILNFIENPQLQHRFTRLYVDIYRPMNFNGKLLGTVYIRSDLSQLNKRLGWAMQVILATLFAAILISIGLAHWFQTIITKPIYSLVETMRIVSEEKNYSVRERKNSEDELGKLIDGFNNMLTQIETRNTELAQATEEIVQLNTRLKAENMRMSAELDITRQLQQMVLPKQIELEQIKELDIYGYMQPADEVGGDYYDVLQYGNRIKIGIGDVTGHGLASGVLMLMVQMAVRTLLVNEVHDYKEFLVTLNRAIYQNARRMGSDKNLTLSLIDYEDGVLHLTGQHEEILVARKTGEVERIDTFDLGFIIGLEPDIDDFVSCLELKLESGDGLILFTDGITEAENINKEFYGVERLSEIVSQNWGLSSHNLSDKVIKDVEAHIGSAKVYDDITLLVIKQR
ncbi:SpoIIE family protein phosphatase [Candidatus Albibeggiatoa sp. nov. BB20]|uniref:SpoIIE family protein phosphatase n=1 Tax=Candidatus Albibeggiatoa sp. nov. BB20 TaxID=3162723 RepID=UPI0033655830